MYTCRIAPLALFVFVICSTSTSLFALGFQVSHTYPVAKYPNYAVAADFNEDGKLDLAVACLGSGTNGLVDVLLGNGDGSFQKAHAVNIGQDVLGVISADFNHDGHADFTAFFKGTVAVVLGHGDGTFAPLVGYNVGGATIEAIATGDFNHDGNLDLITANTSPGNVSVLLGKADGTFGTPINSPAAASPTSIAIGDLNGDGKLDAVTNDSSGGAYVLLGKGDGTFQAPVGYSTSTPLADVAIADLNGDHKLDLLTCAYSNFTIGVADVFLGNGDGTFQAPVTYTAGTRRRSRSPPLTWTPMANSTR
jgi:hypothetical protein